MASKSTITGKDLFSCSCQFTLDRSQHHEGSIHLFRWIDGWLGNYLNLHFPPGRAESVPEDFNLNMATPIFSHTVGRCFQTTEEGSYFEGTGFLKAGTD